VEIERVASGSGIPERPIAMFDSGFGGLTVARAVIDLLPGEDLVYFGDTGRYPYGSRPLEQVREFAVQISDRLVADYDPKMVVVACNTATAAALSVLRERISVPVIGVIGTVGTVASGSYQRAVAESRPEVELVCAACPGFVEFVERGDTRSDQVRVLAERLLAPIQAADVDALLLGCTHYPFLARTIGDVMGRGVTLVSSADETAFAVARILESTGLRSSRREGGTQRFLSSGDVDAFAHLGRRLLGPELGVVEAHRWDIT